MIAISCSGSSDPSSLRAATRQLWLLSCLVPRTKHLGGKDDTETSITYDFAVGVADGSLIARLSVRSGYFDNLVWVIRYFVSVSTRVTLDNSRATLTPLTVEFIPDMLGWELWNNLGILGKKGRVRLC